VLQVLRLLLVEDSESDAELVIALLRRHGYDVEATRVDTEARLRDAVEGQSWDLVLCDHGLPGFASYAAQAIVHETSPELPFVILSGTIGEEATVEALRSGARDVVLKGNLSRIGLVVDRVLEEAHNRRRSRQAEAELRDSEARKSAMLDSALDCVLTIDHDGRIVDFNPAAERTFGYRNQDACGRSLDALIVLPEPGEGGRDSLALQLSRSSSTILGDRVELTGTRADGSEFPIELSLVRSELSGRAFFTAYVRDLTSLKEAEAQRAVLEERLRHAQKMEAVGSLAGGVAHDFNNILLAIRGFSAQLLKGIGDEQQRESVRQIDLAAQRAADLTRQLLAFSRQQVVRPEATDMNVVIDEMLGMLRRLIDESVELTCALEPELETVVVDRGQLGQVVLNLVVNARDAMPDGGALAIETTNAQVDDRLTDGGAEVAPGRYAVLRVADAGVGMDEETRTHLFEPYFTTKPEGTGLGLSTVYGIVKQSGGHITLESEPGAGTTFTVYFPSSREHVVERAEVAAPTALEGDETILVVEDADIIRPLLIETLQEYGYRVIAARNGAEALELAAREPGLDLLLTDIVMPGMNGQELADRLASLYPGLRVLFSSGYPADQPMRERIAGSDSGFIEKPFLPDDLVRAVREILDAD
jgi:two-component system cell cycle sensor histidine kinase/response regulator CckA